MSAGIRLEGVAKTFPAGRAFTALHDVTLTVRPGELLTLVGPSGCGKSTLLDLIGGLAEPGAGTIEVDGRSVRGPGFDRGLVFQQYALLPWRTALANVELGLEAKRVPRRRRRETAREFLDLVGLAAFEDRYPHQLSGGMRQRVAIARSLAPDPAVLLMDEPFAALDAQTRETLQLELLRIWRRTGKTILFITHAIDEAVLLGQRVAVMTPRPGRIAHVLDIPLTWEQRFADARSDPAFVALRHDVWQRLHHVPAEAPGAEERNLEGVSVG